MILILFLENTVIYFKWSTMYRPWGTDYGVTIHIHVTSGYPVPQMVQGRPTFRNFRKLRATGFLVSSSLRTGPRNIVAFLLSLRPCGKSSS